MGGAARADCQAGHRAGWGISAALTCLEGARLRASVAGLLDHASPARRPAAPCKPARGECRSDDIKEPDAPSDSEGVGSSTIFNRLLLAADVADRTGLPRSKAIAAVDAVGHALRDGKEVRIPGFGSFLTNGRSASKGLDPVTGNEVDWPESKSVRFRAGKALRDLVSGTPV